MSLLTHFYNNVLLPVSSYHRQFTNDNETTLACVQVRLTYLL